MKNLHITLLLLSMALFCTAYAMEQPKKKSFGDKDHKYKSSYKKKNNGLRKTINIHRADGGYEKKSMKNKPDSSRETTDEIEDLNS